MTQRFSTEGRLFALDALRGLDMIFLCVGQPLIVAVAKAFDCADAVAHPIMRQFNHYWGGFTAYDLIMPLFIFMCGAAIPLALPKRLSVTGRPTASYWTHGAWRVVLLWALGMVCQGRLLGFDHAKFVYYSNTLQAIAVGYLVATVVFLIRNRFVRVLVPFGLAVVYGLLLHFGGDYTAKGNLAMRVDMLFVGVLQPNGHDTGEYTWYLTSLMFVAMTLCGMEATHILKSTLSQWRKVGLLSAVGVALWVVGLALEHSGVPCIKQIFTVSFTAQAMGVSVLLLSVIYILTDIWKCRCGWGLVLLYGKCALAAYVLGVILRPIPAAAAQTLFGGLAKRIGGPWEPVVLQIGFTVALTSLLVLWKRARSCRSISVGGSECMKESKER